MDAVVEPNQAERIRQSRLADAKAVADKIEARKLERDQRAEQAYSRFSRLSVDFVPAADRLLIDRLPPEKEGFIMKAEAAIEQSDMGFVIAVGGDVQVPKGVVARFSKFSAEEIKFDDEGDFILAYKQDIRGWFPLKASE